MAEPIEHQVTPPKIGPDAHEELEKLLQTLHEHGVLRFANDIVGANQSVAKVLVDGLNKEGSLNAMQNLSALMMALSTIPPERFYKVVFSLRDAMNAAGEQREKTDDDEAPGFTGAYRLLHDDELWQAITPLLEALKAFGRGMDREVDKPITDFTGKPSSA
ncbi:uncharacterized protein YjgD (DUF1641 family) [Kushneria sinocarnis]|uniref:Uncharacterized protein YjgD (DUF1641 family) n=1 Tax=Kushneria sinocarnis TaxID=595502 RepID=A0A420WUQ9_9GAMM|nr:DUF1641 domain-containing protein [Kushneria sinocarnis]RKQ97185.1 uncharacterized protein YjgD (DUF1641 family) [Kushneria sinocarnis]